MERIWDEMFKAAKAVQNGRKISDYVEAGGAPPPSCQTGKRVHPAVHAGN